MAQPTALNFNSTYCGAAPGMNCRSHSGGYSSWYWHDARGIYRDAFNDGFLKGVEASAEASEKLFQALEEGAKPKKRHIKSA
jgi:hypothetical protein